MAVNPGALAAQVFAASYGALVTGGPKTLPATASGDIFTVTGGRVIITSLTGVVSTAIQAQATTLSVGNKPVGTSLAVPLAKTSALLVSGADGTVAWNGSAGGQGSPFTAGGLALIPAGTIQVTTGATSTGAVTWSVTYIPYDAGATVAAA